MLDFDMRLFHYLTWAILNEKREIAANPVPGTLLRDDHCCLFSLTFILTIYTKTNAFAKPDFAQ